MQIPQTAVVLRHDGAELAPVILSPGEYLIGRGTGVAIRAHVPLHAYHREGSEGARSSLNSGARAKPQRSMPAEPNFATPENKP